MENADNRKEYRFFLLHTDITENTAAALIYQVSKFPHFSIDIVNVGEYITGYDFFTENRPNFTKEAYFRLLIPELLPLYDKIIYLDGDLVCLFDISELYNINLGDNLIAAARDLSGINRFLNIWSDIGEKKRDLKNDMQVITDYFNSGVVILNNSQLKKTISSTELLDLAVSKNWKNHDQDVLNFVTEGKTHFLPYEWNFIYTGNLNNLPEQSRREYSEAKKSPKIIHFAGIRDKPWLNPLNVPHFELFWKYATRTPFINIIVDRMRDMKLINKTSQEFVLSEIKNQKGIMWFTLKCIMTWLQKNKANN